MVVGIVPRDAGNIMSMIEDIDLLPLHIYAPRAVSAVAAETSIFRRLSVI
ncbi:hypothetical protein KCP71_09480 [Salmonella enterica subsp. enterica]|nr:hypothetical protein KCP71_09480 [Salmonella enterica subsp. enterica]